MGQEVDEITRTGWASLQRLESGSAGKLVVAQEVLGWESDGTGTSRKEGKRREEEEEQECRANEHPSHAWVQGSLGDGGNGSAGGGAPAVQEGACPGARWRGGGDGHKTGTPARGTFLRGAEVWTAREGSRVPSDQTPHSPGW